MRTWFKKNLKYSHSCLGLSRSFFYVDRCLHLHRRPLVLKPIWVHYSFPLRLFLWLFLDLKWWHIQIIKFTSCFRSWVRIFEKDWYVLTLMGAKSQYSLNVLGVFMFKSNTELGITLQNLPLKNWPLKDRVLPTVYSF